MTIQQQVFSRSVLGVLIAVFSCASIPTPFVSATITRSTAKAEKPWVMPYYAGYQNDYLKPRDIDFSVMTHIVVGGVGINADGSLNEHWHMPKGGGNAMALDVGKRAKRADVKTLVWLGGPNEEDKLYAATSDAVRSVTVKNILALVDRLGYDGVDIDWEPIRAQDGPRLVALVRDLRAARPDLLITVPVNWVASSIIFKKDLSLYKELSLYVDKLFIMSYSMAGPWDDWQSWHTSALAGDTKSTPTSVKTSVFAYLRAGVPKEKLGIGVATYAVCWEYPVTRPAQLLPTGFTSAKVHSMSMRTMLGDYYASKRERWDTKAQVPYVSFTKETGDFSCGFISYENKRSLALKGEYVRKQGLGGVIVWNLGTGYAPDSGSKNRHALLRSIYTTVRP